MPAFTLPGLSSGHNTNDIVRQLVDLESRPIKRWEKENNYSQVQIQAWKELKKLTTTYQQKTKALISFTAPFSSKKISSSEEGVISGEASRSAKAGNQKIEIMQLATRNKVAGKKISMETKLPGGAFTILSKDERVDINFEGGDIYELKEKINRHAKIVVDASVTRVDKDNLVISLHARQYGEDAKLKFLDPSGILQAAGLVGGNVPEPPPSSSMVSISSTEGTPFRSERFTGNKGEAGAPSSAEGGVSLKPGTAYIFPVPEFKPKKYSKLEFMILSGSESLPEYLGVGVRYKDGEEEKTRFENLVREGNKYVLQVANFARDKKITGFIFSNPGETDITYGIVNYVIPGEITGAAPATTIVPAQNAKFKVDGIEVTRDRNDDIRDAIEGVTLNILKTTKEPVEMKIDVDTSKGMMMVKEWVVSYNELLKFSKDITISNKSGSVDLKNNVDDNRVDISEDYWNIKNKSGLLAGDNAVLQLIAGLKTTVGASYPSSTEPRYKVLSDIGISTGELGSSWKNIQEGLLVINEEVLNVALSDNPDSVKELFASDNNSDNRHDDGVGIKTLTLLKPYTSFKSGIVSSKISLLEENMRENDKRIKDYQSHLVSYEKRLKMKFQYMEQGVGRHKATGTYLRNNYRHVFGDQK
ncbi:MAG: flagellar filament capping protein FliD [Leptospiraceae bacterium]|nr:flagellar filament capping protein FliD [Leptospiraceae bacterium]MCP5498704.1 flagellar filament capping protein FliD [Leptospiraceae bacterium]